MVFKERQFTYRELNARANQLANYLLLEKAIQPGSLVGICIERSLDMIVGILGILKAGGAYVPLDPEYPAARLTYMIDDAQLSTILTYRHLLDCTPIMAQQAVCLDEPDTQQLVAEHSGENLQPHQLEVTASHLAYVIYTSGSTGQPKGVMIQHASVNNLWLALHGAIYQSLPAHLRVAVNAGFSFDASVKMWIQLLSGASLLILPEGIRFDGASLLEWLQKCRVDVLDCTPAQLQLLLEEGLLDTEEYFPQAVLVGGEDIPAETWVKLGKCERTRFFNVYGPTECTVDATVAHVRASDPMPNIGRPLVNTQMYIVDQHMQPVPTGVVGELLIGGVQVARGYLNDPS